MRRICFPILLLAVVLSLFGCATQGPQTAPQPGTGEPLAAAYKEETITQAGLETYKKQLAYVEGEENLPSDREILDSLLKNIILLEEAQAQGLTPTQGEIETYLQETLYTACALPEGKALIDDYCASQGVPYADYEADLRDQAPRFLARAKLKEKVARDYCQAHNLTWEANNWPQEVQEAVAAYEEDLWQTHKKDVIYYR